MNSLQTTTKRTIYFRADCGSHIGFGHVSRCKVIAKEFQKNGWNVIFLARQHFGAHESNFAPFPVIFIAQGLTQKEAINVQEDYALWLGNDPTKEFQYILKSIVNSNSVIFIDHYAINKDTEKKLIENNFFTVVLDDISRNHNSHLTFSYFEHANNAKLPSDFFGLKFAPVDSKFCNYIFQQQSKIVHKVLINLGTADHALIAKIANCLDKCKLKLFVDILSPASIALENYNNLNIRFIPLTDKIEVVNLNYDFIIGAAGVAMLERIVQKIPCINFIVVNNQKKITEQFINCPIHHQILDLRSLNASSLINILSLYIDNYSSLKLETCNCKLDAEGAQRIYEVINSQCLK